ncbi:uncharacterized protein EMH_0100440 [Eimeria mitis]|uniref:Uncharacterized protein n=1 Tax=Eimeria mitis TaxID=44415 RepID=U6KG24_9EIME|nr:uncharacterized protein EMH_0100440 [Eimeria mitis]CDJ35741.1 hypothetical protein EMH_0100440 [Eimeria mitis]
MLNKGERLLQVHQTEIEQLQKRDKLSAQPAVQQAKEVGEELKALLEAAALRMHSITGIASAEESAQGVWGQKTIDAMASRARQDVKATSKRVTNILARVQLGQLFLPQPDTTQIHKQEGVETKTIVNPTVLKLVTESLQQLRDNITAVAVSLNLSSEASETKTGLAAAAQRATVAAKELAEKAEMLLLRAQFLESLELDLQLSSRLAQRAAALAGAGAEDIQQANQVSVELPAPQKKQVGLLLHQVNTTKAKAMSQWTLVDLVKTAATMKGAGLGLALTVWAHQLDSTLRTKQ